MDENEEGVMKIKEKSKTKKRKKRRGLEEKEGREAEGRNKI